MTTYSQTENFEFARHWIRALVRNLQSRECNHLYSAPYHQKGEIKCTQGILCNFGVSKEDSQIHIPTQPQMTSRRQRSLFTCIFRRINFRSVTWCPHTLARCISLLHLYLLRRHIVPSSYDVTFFRFPLFLLLLLVTYISADAHQDAGGKVHDEAENGEYERPGQGVLQTFDRHRKHNSAYYSYNAWKKDVFVKHHACGRGHLGSRSMSSQGQKVVSVIKILYANDWPEGYIHIL